MRLIVLLLAWPLAEIMVLILVGGRIGALSTLGIILATGIFGLSLIRKGGIRGLAGLGSGPKLSESGQAGSGAAEVARTLFGILAAILLVLPGIIGDAVGLLLLVGPVQRWLMALVGAAMLERVAGLASQRFARPRGEEVIDGAYEVLDQPEAETKAPSGWTRH